MTCTLNREDLVDSVTKNGNSPFTSERTERTSKHARRRRLLKLNPAFTPIAENTWRSENEYKFVEAFRHLRTLFRDLPKEAILLLSTCGTAERAFQAIAFELHAWCGSFGGFEPHSPSLGDAIRSSKVDIAEDGHVTTETLWKIFWSVIRINEARKKQQIWNRDYDSLRVCVLVGQRQVLPES